MANTIDLQERYGNILIEKAREVLVSTELFNKNYDGSPAAGLVKAPISNKATVQTYDRNGNNVPSNVETSYKDILIENDIMIMEIIDKFEAEAVPFEMYANRVNEAGIAIAEYLQETAYAKMVTGGTPSANTTPSTKDTIYENAVDERTAIIKATGKKMGFVMSINPDIENALLKSPEFISASGLGDRVKSSGVIGNIAGMDVVMGTTLPAGVEFVISHKAFVTEIMEWSQPLSAATIGVGTGYVGGTEINGRVIFQHAVLDAIGVRVKTAVWTDLELTSVTDTNAVFNATVVDAGEAITGGLNLAITEQGGSAIGSTPLTVGVNEDVSITEALTPETTYEATVIAIINEGSSQIISDVITFTTEATA